MKRRLLLYTRRGNIIRGPFPSKQVTRHILLGRLSSKDEVSTDQINWRKLTEFPDIIPDEIKGNLDNPEAQERLRLARYREDERLSDDRRGLTQTGGEDNRKPGERRSAETIDVKKHRAVKTEIFNEGKQQQKVVSIGVLAGIVAVILFVAYFVNSTPVKVNFVKQCTLIPGPNVDWRDCQLEGSSLDEADLENAQMRNINLTGSSISNANLSHSDLAYGNYSMVNFKYSNLSYTNLLGSVLRNADISNTNMLNANLSFAILQSANLAYANLQNANLSNADLSGANITGVNLSGAKLGNAIWVDQKVCSIESVGKCLFSEIEPETQNQKGSIMR